jgi:sterol desaturase/sphingolipid hydroxylase (fatty acid hydroxylase superfamily)
MLHEFFHTVEARILLLSLFFLFGFLVERLIPARPSVDVPGMLLNWMIGFFFLVGEAIAAMLVASIFVKFAWNGLSSLIEIPDRGSMIKAFGLGFAWIATRDFFYYWLHRSQHASKWLWAEHALHHSEENLNVTTSVRHHWLEMPLNTVFVVAPLTYLIRPPLITVPLVALTIGMVGTFIHMNARVGFGRFGWLIASPQNHRIHHSRLPEHMDKNFAQFFPLWDVLFGTYYRARPDEYPPTGLASGEQVKTLRGSLLMPFVAWRKMLWPK